MTVYLRLKWSIARRIYKRLLLRRYKRLSLEEGSAIPTKWWHVSKRLSCEIPSSIHGHQRLVLNCMMTQSMRRAIRTKTNCSCIDSSCRERKSSSRYQCSAETCYDTITEARGFGHEAWNTAARGKEQALFLRGLAHLMAGFPF